MKNVFRNVRFFLVWAANTVYSVKDLRLDTPVSLPVFITSVLVWFMVLNYIFLF
jgi:hypothetical protein